MKKAALAAEYGAYKDPARKRSRIDGDVRS
jgi:hypothetical protein